MKIYDMTLKLTNDLQKSFPFGDVKTTCSLFHIIVVFMYMSMRYLMFEDTLVSA